MMSLKIKVLGWEEIQDLIHDLLEWCLESTKDEDIHPLIRIAQILNAAEELEDEVKKDQDGDCFCPFVKEHCTDGKVESRPNDECEFWNPQVGDCRVRLVLVLLEKRFKGKG